MLPDHKSGLRIFHAPQAVVIHHGGGSSRTQFSKFSEVMIREALDFYFRTNHGRLFSLLYRLLILLSAISRMTILWLRGLLSRDERRVALQASISKWWTLLRWSLGLENWAANWFHFGKGTAVPQNVM